MAWCNEHIFSLALCLLFIICVGLGITGSSLGFYKQLPGSDELISLAGERKLFGVYRGIRGDEFIAHGTATALQQYHHHPAFPRINRNCGVEGRCYLALHDLGAPVRHISMLGRPAVWGFFFLDLRRALSWYWLLPLFLGIWGCKFFLDTLFPGQEKINILLSLALTLSAHAGAWSFWPVNNIYGIFIAGALVVKLIESEKKHLKFIYAVLAAWMLYCAFMSLYMPRVIPMVSLTGIVIAGYITDRKMWKKLFSPVNIAAIMMILILLAALIGIWYSDAAESIERIAGSVYPGRRRDYGGDMAFWMMNSGYIAPLTIYKSSYLNQSELQGYFNLFPLLAAWTVFQWRNLNKRAIWGALWIFTGAAYIYQFIGFPRWIAEITFWSRCTPSRLQWVLNTVQILMLALIWHGSRANKFRELPARWSYAVVAAMTVWGIGAIMIMPPELLGGFKLFLPSRLVILLLVASALSAGFAAWLFFKDFWWFIIFYAVINVLPGIIFNPVCIAPYAVENRLIDPEDAAKLPYEGRVLMADGNDFLAVCYSLCGGRVFNSYFMYYDSAIDKLLFQNMSDREQFNRMNHLDIELSSGDAPDFAAKVTHFDRIKVTFNAEKYNFAYLPVDIVGSQKADVEKLSANPSLTFWKSGKTLCFFKVNRPEGR